MRLKKKTRFGEITLTASEGRLDSLLFADEKERVDFSGGSTPSDAALLDRAFSQLEEYFSGGRRTFDLPIVPATTSFRKKMRDAILRIPFGKTATYAETARVAGSSSGARAAGNACGTNPLPIIIPCHRVVAAHGIGGFSCGLDIKRRLLRLEEFAMPEYWTDWKPEDECVLMFLRVKGRVLLIVKKRGLGKGKVNAPGGHIEPGETAMQAAVRETQEEVGLTPLCPRYCGRLQFAFLNGYTERCEVFQADAYNGTLRATEEADPFWCDEAVLPFDRMWADDHFWVPLMLSGKEFDFRFVFDDDQLLWQLK